jgi:hypothetical protein
MVDISVLKFEFLIAYIHAVRSFLSKSPFLSSHRGETDHYINGIPMYGHHMHDMALFWGGKKILADRKVILSLPQRKK